MPSAAFLTTAPSTKLSWRVCPPSRRPRLHPHQVSRPSYALSPRSRNFPMRSRRAFRSTVPLCPLHLLQLQLLASWAPPARPPRHPLTRDRPLQSSPPSRQLLHMVPHWHPPLQGPLLLPQQCAREPPLSAHSVLPAPTARCCRIKVHARLRVPTRLRRVPVRLQARHVQARPLPLQLHLGRVRPLLHNRRPRPHGAQDVSTQARVHTTLLKSHPPRVRSTSSETATTPPPTLPLVRAHCSLLPLCRKSRSHTHRQCAAPTPSIGAPLSCWSSKPCRIVVSSAPASW